MMSTPDLVDLMKDVQSSLAGGKRLVVLEGGSLTDDWQAREILAELGARQMQLDYGALSK